MKKSIVAMIELMRVKHWLKNFLIFVPILCSDKLDINMAPVAITGFLSFSLLTSFVYIINDIKDIEKDKQHPRKKNRPLPSGRIAKTSAIYLAIVLLLASYAFNYIATGWSFMNLSFVFLTAYLVINLGYSSGLKNIEIIDVVILSAGFVLRVYYGASLVDVTVSSWLFLTIMSSSMFLALGKRRRELLVGAGARKVLQKYNDAFLDKFMYVSLSLMFVFYALWSMEQNTPYLVFTTVFIVVIFMRYCLVLERTDEGDPTTIIYSDIPLLGMCVLYAILMIVIFGFL